MPHFNIFYNLGMKKYFMFGICFALASCAGDKLKIRENEIGVLKAERGKLDSQIKNRDELIAALENTQQDLGGKINELSEKLKATQTQADSLTQSNKDLSRSIEAGKGELSIKIKELITAKDELGRKLAEAQKEKAALQNAKDKAIRDNGALRERNKALQAELAPLNAEMSLLKAKREQEQAYRQERQTLIHSQAQALAGVCQKEMEAGQIKIEEQAAGFSLTIQGPLLFEFQQAKLIKNASAFLDRLASALRDSGWSVRVEAHADNSPLKRSLLGGFSSALDLTNAQAGAVVRYLHEHAGLDSKLLSAAALGDSNPAASNDTPEGQASNRRVILTVEPPAGPQ